MIDTVEIVNKELYTDVIDSLSQAQKSINCRWFYDERGSQLFEDITNLPEYYPTRTEAKILRAYVDELATAIGEDAVLVEYGAGASVKTRILLDRLNALIGYVPLDVSKEFLLQSAAQLREQYPHLKVEPVVANFLERIELPEISPSAHRVGFFPGSTIGNLSDDEIQLFFRRARTNLGAQSQFILGFDLRKSPSILVPAYDDAAGVTAAFNLNVLRRINREAGGDFDLSAFEHEARWNDEASRIELHIVSRKSQIVRIGDNNIQFAAGEKVHTENSRKFSIEMMDDFVSRAGWQIEHTYSDEDKYFAVTLLRAV